MRLVRGRAAGDADDLLDALRAVADDHGVTVQAFDARYVADRAHLERAVELADRARDRDEAIARDRAVEILLYAAGRRQIERALEMGVTDDGPVVVLVDDPEGDSEREAAAAAAVEECPELVLEESVAPDEAAVCEFFRIGERERAATGASLAELVRERVALLVVER